MSSSVPSYSVIVPVYNEEKNVARLHKEIEDAMASLKKPYEIIFVDDASKDNTCDELKKLTPITIIQLRRNSGQSAALDAGIKQARGEVLITMDGDGQNDPADIPNLISHLESNQNIDVVCGWRKNRKDSFEKRFVSGVAAHLRKFLVNDGVHDAGCTFRVYKKECFEDLDLYGELHRMIPALLRWRGFHITELSVNHREREYGVSKYNWSRILKGFLDMLYIWFWRKYAHRPLHLFGGIGVFSTLFGVSLLFFLSYKRLFEGYSLSDKIWPLIGFFSVVLGIQLVMTGMLANYLTEMKKEKRYVVKRIIRL